MDDEDDGGGDVTFEVNGHGDRDNEEEDGSAMTRMVIVGLFEVDGVFHVAGGQDDLAWTDQVNNNDDEAIILIMMIMTIQIVIIIIVMTMMMMMDHGEGAGLGSRLRDME